MAQTVCPKCGTEPPEGMTTCYRCGYLFDSGEVVRAEGGAAAIEQFHVDDPKCIVCGAEIASYATVCVACGATVTPWDGYEDDYGEEEEDEVGDDRNETEQEINENYDRKKAELFADLDEEERAEHLAQIAVIDNIQSFGRIYGWRTTRKMWKETKGFVTGVENALSKYRAQSGSVNFRIVRALILALRAHPDPDVIEEEIENWYQDELTIWTPSYDECDDYITEDEFDAFGHIYTVEEIKQHLQEQRWVDVENACFYERVEATLQKDGNYE